jgi:hypothetical protein
MSDDERSCIAFEGSRRLAEGPLDQVRPQVQAAMARGAAHLLVFDSKTSEPVEVSPADAPQVPRRSPGRPKLGVVAREVTLLPRHWDWLARQPGGASVALRKLVEDARRTASRADEVRQARDAAYRFMSAIGGNLPGFEEATRALFRGDAQAFRERIADWPADVRGHARALADRGFAAS